MTPHFNNAGRFYPWLVVVVVVSAVAMIVWQMTQLIDSAESFNSFFWSTKNYLALSLSIVAAATLVWRIVFALLYKTVPSVHDGRLPKVTIVIPAFNEGEQVLFTVRSILDSDYPAHKMQVICVDDGSQDDTWQWMLKAREQFGEKVKLIRQPNNRGKRMALLAGFGQATGEILVTIDSDSEVLPDTLRNLVSPYVVDERVGAVAGNVRVLNLDEGAIPKMMEVSFTNAFDFVRSGQSVYGGVFCTPGALSSYRAEVVRPHLAAWADQTFMGKPATIGEDRALTNIVLGTGHRVVYQRNAVVLTKMPTKYTGLRKMLLRWARSNVREHLVMLSFVLKPQLRPNDSGANWLRLFSLTQMFRMATAEAFKFVVLIQLIAEPVATLSLITTGCLIASIIPGLVHQIRYGGIFGWKWAIAFSFYWLFSLCWIPLWGTFTATQSGWLTRGLASLPQAVAHSPLTSSKEAEPTKTLS